MKGVIVEIKNNRAAVLTDNGVVKLVKNNNYFKGQVISVKKTNKLAIISASVAAVVTLSAMGSYVAYATPYSIVSLDVNPSLELSLNRFDQVLEVLSANEDALKILNVEELENKKIDEALKIATSAIVDGGFIGDDKGGIVISASSKNEEKANELAETLKNETEETVKENIGEDSNVVVEATAVGQERVARAHDLGVTAGKLNLIEKLAKNLDNEADNEFVESWKDMPVKDIMSASKLVRKQAQELEKEMNKLSIMERQMSNENKGNQEKLQQDIEESKKRIEKLLDLGDVIDENKDNIKDVIKNIEENIDGNVDDIIKNLGKEALKNKELRNAIFDVIKEGSEGTGEITEETINKILKSKEALKAITNAVNSSLDESLEISSDAVEELLKNDKVKGALKKAAESMVKDGENIIDSVIDDVTDNKEVKNAVKEAIKNGKKNIDNVLSSIEDEVSAVSDSTDIDKKDDKKNNGSNKNDAESSESENNANNLNSNKADKENGNSANGSKNSVDDKTEKSNGSSSNKGKSK